MKPTEIQGLVFPALTDTQRKTLLSRCTPRAYAKGETIFSRGEPGSLIFVIETGRVEVSVTSRRGRRTILNQMGPGEVLGELAMLDGDPRSADARAATEATGRILTRQHFLVFLSDFPEMAAAIIQEICRKLRNLSDLHADQLATDGARRLALVLSRLFSKWGEKTANGEVYLDRSFSQSDLVDFAGLARENVNRRLRSWTQDGLLRTDGSRLVLTDPARLQRLAND